MATREFCGKSLATMRNKHYTAAASSSTAISSMLCLCDKYVVSCLAGVGRPIFACVSVSVCDVREIRIMLDRAQLRARRTPMTARRQRYLFEQLSVGISLHVSYT